MPEGLTMTEITFKDNDEAYRAWIADHPDGYVLNTFREPKPAYLILHRADCVSISSGKIFNYTTGRYIKICSLDVEDLERWSKYHTGGDLHYCQLCHG